MQSAPGSSYPRPSATSASPPITSISGGTESATTSTSRDAGSASLPAASEHPYATSYAPSADASTVSRRTEARATGPRSSTQRAPASSYPAPTGTDTLAGPVRATSGGARSAGRRVASAHLPPGSMRNARPSGSRSLVPSGACAPPVYRTAPCVALGNVLYPSRVSPSSSTNLCWSVMPPLICVKTPIVLSTAWTWYSPEGDLTGSRSPGGTENLATAGPAMPEMETV